MADSIQTTLQTRAMSHGDFRHVATTSQNLKRVLNSSSIWREMEPWQQEAMEQISMKLARIMSGNSFDIDHWHDIAGYASLVVREIERRDVEMQLETGLRRSDDASKQLPKIQEMIREMPDEPRE